MMVTLGPCAIYAQAPDAGHDAVYGFDPLLYNGRVYYFYPHPGTKGSQYLFEQFDTLASVSVRGVVYSQSAVNYDILNQQFVLKYKNTLGSWSLIEISDAWLDWVVIYGCRFERMEGATGGKRIYQVLGSGKEKILCYYFNELLIDNQLGAQARYFSAPHKEMYFQVNNQLIPIHNTRNFIHAVSPARQSMIKTYLRQNKIRIKKANDMIINGLINYCNSLPG